jgi:hypothetical protein
VQPLLKLKKEALDIADQPQALTPGGDRNIHISNHSNTPLEPVAEEGRGENEVVQPVNPAANPTANHAANVAANATANPPTNVTANAVSNVANNAANDACAQPNIATNPRQNAGAQPLSAQANHAEGSQRRNVRDEVEIARHANYDRDHGVPYALDANNPVQATELQNMPNMTKIMVLLTTSTLYRWLMPHQPVREQSTTLLHFHNVSGRSDTPKTSNPPLRNTTVALTQVYGSKCKASQHAPQGAMKTTWQDTSPL